MFANDFSYPLRKKNVKEVLIQCFNFLMKQLKSLLWHFKKTFSLGFFLQATPRTLHCPHIGPRIKLCNWATQHDSTVKHSWGIWVCPTSKAIFLGTESTREIKKPYQMISKKSFEGNYAIYILRKIPLNFCSFSDEFLEFAFFSISVTCTMSAIDDNRFDKTYQCGSELYILDILIILLLLNFVRFFGGSD